MPAAGPPMEARVGRYASPLRLAVLEDGEPLQAGASLTIIEVQIAASQGD